MSDKVLVIPRKQPSRPWTHCVKAVAPLPELDGRGLEPCSWWWVGGRRREEDHLGRNKPIYLTGREGLNYWGCDWHPGLGGVAGHFCKWWLGDWGILSMPAWFPSFDDGFVLFQVAHPIRCYLDMLYLTICRRLAMPSLFTDEMAFNEQEKAIIHRVAKTHLSAAIEQSSRLPAYGLGILEAWFLVEKGQKNAVQARTWLRERFDLSLDPAKEKLRGVIKLHHKSGSEIQNFFDMKVALLEEEYTARNIYDLALVLGFFQEKLSPGSVSHLWSKHFARFMHRWDVFIEEQNQLFEEDDIRYEFNLLDTVSWLDSACHRL